MWGKRTVGLRVARLRSRQGKITPVTLAVALAVTAFVVLGFAAISGAAPGTDASVSVYDQCANDKPPSTATTVRAAGSTAS